MSFRTIAIITLVLGTGYLLAGTILVGRWQIEPTQSVLLFLGIPTSVPDNVVLNSSHFTG